MLAIRVARRALVLFKNQIQRRTMRELWRTPESAVAKVKQLRERFDLRVDDGDVERAVGAAEGFRLRHRIRQRIRRFLQIRAAAFKGINYGQQHAPESRPAKLVLGREIGPSEKRPAIRQQESGQWPAALPRNRADRGLVARIHVRSLVAVDFDRDEVLVDDLRDDGIFVAFSVNDMAPMAPHRADIQQNRFVLLFRTGKSFLVPFIPIDRLMRRGTEIGAGGILQAIWRMRGHEQPLNPFRILLGARAGYWTVSFEPVSRGSSGLRPANPSSCRW